VIPSCVALVCRAFINSLPPPQIWQASPPQNLNLPSTRNAWRPRPSSKRTPLPRILGNTVAALGQDTDLVLLRQQLDLDAGSRLLPRLSDQMLFQTRQATLWRAIMRGYS
jgi:hypothetical protein